MTLGEKRLNPNNVPPVQKHNIKLTKLRNIIVKTALFENHRRRSHSLRPHLFTSLIYFFFLMSISLLLFCSQS